MKPKTRKLKLVSLIIAAAVLAHAVALGKETNLRPLAAGERARSSIKMGVKRNKTATALNQKNRQYERLGRVLKKLELAAKEHIGDYNQLIMKDETAGMTPLKKLPSNVAVKIEEGSGARVSTMKRGKKYVLCIKIGVDLAESLTSDDELAWLLGHELVHLYEEHQGRGFEIVIRTSKDIFNILQPRLQSREFIADKIAIKLVEWAGYDPDPRLAIMALRIIRKLEQRDSEHRIEKGRTFKTHPSIGHRIEVLKKLYGETDSNI